MATNRDLLKQAIADAKTVKETAIANATAALEESFAPYLREKLAAKLAEIDSMDEEMEDETMDEGKALSASEKETGYNKVAKHQAMKNRHYEKMEEEMEDETMDEGAEEEKEAYDMDENKTSDASGYTKTAKHQAMKNAHYEKMDEEMEDETKSMDEELEELLRELDMEDESMDEVINDPKGPGSHGNVSPHSGVNDTDLMEAKKEKDDDDEEVNIEDMSEEDLKAFIEDVIHDMVESGELEAGHEGMENEEGEEEIELDDEEGETMDEGSGYTKTAKHQAMKNSHYEKMMDEMKKELDEAYKALAQVRTDLNEVNLLNSKLLYTNKIFKAKNLTDSQKIKVLEAFDKATNKKEAKLVYETMLESVNTLNKTPVNESVKSIASKVISGNAPRAKQPIIEVNDAFARMQKLAGLKK